MSGNDWTVGIVGIGRMGKALSEGMEKAGFKVIEKGRGDSNCLKLAECDAVILCVKPKDLSSAAGELCTAMKETQPHPLIISIVAGKNLSLLEGLLGKERIVRAMPNLAARVGKSFTCFCKNSGVEEKDIFLTKNIFSAIGSWLEVEENMLDATTALSGSGPAYFLYLMEALSEGGKSIGIDEDTSKRLARMALIGAAGLAEQSSSDASLLISEIATPGGTTEAALNVFKRRALKEIAAEALSEAKKKCTQLAKQP